MANYNLTQTGAQVQALLDTVAAGYIYMGVADLTTTPDTTNPNVCYLLSAVGTYTNFGNIAHSSGITLAMWNGTAWSAQNVPSAAVVATDATPTGYSMSPVQSGGVAEIVGKEIVLQPDSINNAFLSAGKYYDNNSYQVAIYHIPNTSVKISADILLDRATLDYAVLFSALPSNGSSGTKIISPVTQNASVSATITGGGYLALLYKNGNAFVANNVVVKYTEVSNLPEQIDNNTESIEALDDKVSTLERDVLKDISSSFDSILSDRYIISGGTNNGKISSHTGSLIYAYQANKGEAFHIEGILSNSSAYGFFAFKEGSSAPVQGDSTNLLAPYGNVDKNVVSLDYTTPSDGWVLVGFTTSSVANRYSGYYWALYKQQIQTDSASLTPIKKINAVVGDTLQIFNRGISKVIDTKDYDFRMYCRYGSSYPRYFEYTPASNNTGKQHLYVNLCNIGGQSLALRHIELNVVAKPSSPSSAKNILILGDSLTQAGIWPHETDERLTSSRTKTDTMPAGLNLSNINFIGSMENSGTHYFGVGGWGWGSYATEGAPAFRFQVTGVSTIVKGAVYSNNGHNYTIMENNTTGGNGNILASVSSATDTPTTSGTLTKVSGSGDSSITFTSAAADQQNPLWNGSGISFSSYLTRLGASSLDYVLFLLGWNDIKPDQTDFQAIGTNIASILSQLHAEYPTAKAAVIGLQVPSLDGGMGANYGASGGYSDTFGMMRAAFNYNEYLQGLAESETYNSFLSYIDLASQFDSENNMPKSAVQVNTRNVSTEMRGTNGIHPDTSGQYQIADVAYRWICSEL